MSKEQLSALFPMGASDPATWVDPATLAPATQRAMPHENETGQFPVDVHGQPGGQKTEDTVTQ
eukprot:COSAG06_NODE_13946_length_1203_cov_1.059783_2_plen_63_part_00